MDSRVKLLLFPCNGNTIEALDCIDLAKYNVIGFIDDDKNKIGKKFHGVKVFDRSILIKELNAKILAVPGSPTSYKNRDKIINKLNLSKKRFISIIHDSAHISNYASVGFNCLIMEGVVIKASSTIGDNVCILPNSVIHHDSIIKDNTLIGSNVVIAGHTMIEKNCYIGSGSKIINNVSIGEGSLIGIGSTVIKSFPKKMNKLVGNPAAQINN